MKKRPERIIKRLVLQFKQARLELGLSHDGLAKKSGVTRAAISHIEGGRRKPSLFMALKLSQALNKELSEMLIIAETQEPPKS